MDDRQLLLQVLEEVKLLRDENERLKLRIAELESRLERYGNPKNSGNSSVPPSQDPFRKTEGLRGKSKRKPGGQKGRKGKKLEMAEVPDKVVLHDIARCACCGNDLVKEAEGYDRRQIFDLPPIAMEVTGHRRLHKTCGNCGKSNKGTFPEGLEQGAQYGPRLKSLCVYLQNYQMLPYARCAEFIEDLTGHGIAIGSLSNFQGRCFADLEGYEQAIREQLLRSPVLHADETVVRLGGKNSWMHVISNGTASLFAYHPNRGKKAMDDMGVLELYRGTLVHDRFSSYFSYNCGHSLCNAHILRDLVYVEEAFEADWAEKIRKLLVKAKRDRERDPDLKASYCSRVSKKYTGLIRPVIKKYDKKLKKTDQERLAFALERHKHLFLKFIKQPQVPFDNNQA